MFIIKPITLIQFRRFNKLKNIILLKSILLFKIYSPLYIFVPLLFNLLARRKSLLQITLVKPKSHNLT